MAATSTLKLVLDDKEYSASIRSAKQGMNDLQQSLQTAGKSFTEVDKQVVDYAKAIGNMNTVAKDSKGQLREMSQTLTDLTRVYRQLTDEEKSSDFGKALSSSIKTLTDRAGEVQDAMGDVQASIKNAASDTRTFDQLSQGAQVALSGFQGLTGAAKLLGIEIGDDVQVIANLQSAMALMNSLTAIQNALQKESALMMGVVVVQTKAAAAAQTLLAKNTALATAAGRALNVVAKANPVALIASAAIAAGTALFALGRQEDEHVDKMKEAEKAAEDLKKAYEDLANKTAGNLYGKLVTLQASWEKLQTNGEKTQWITKNANAFKELGISISSIKDAEDVLVNNTSAIVEAITLRARAAVLTKQIEASLENGITNPGSGEGFAPEGKYTIGFGVSQSLAKELADVESQIDSITKKWQKSGLAGGGGAGGAGASASLVPQYSVAGLTEDLRYLQQEQAKATSTEEWKTYQDAIRSVNDEVKKLKGELSALGTDNTTGGISISRMLSENVTKRQEAFKTQKLEVKPAEKEKKNTAKDVGDLIGSVSTIANSLQQIGVEIPEGFNKVLGGMQAVITILEAIQTIETVGSILGVFSRGGVVHAASGAVVPGNHFSGDMVPALLNSQELVLNTAQTNNLANALQDNKSGLYLDTEITAEAIRIVLNNNSRRRSRGEYVTTKMRN